MDKTISAMEAAILLANSDGRIFTVTFQKRTTGEMRVMNCRTGVKKHLAGGEPAYDFAAKGLLPVYDLQNGGYRCLPFDGVKSVRLDGTTYTVVA